MTDNQLKRILTKPLLLSRTRILVLCLIGACLGWATTLLNDYYNAPKIVVRKSAYAIDYEGYLALVVDRQRNSTCNLHPNRIIYSLASINGQSIPVILPLGDQAIVWPFLGDRKFAVLIAKENEIPPGKWYAQTFLTDNCHWWNLVFGAKVEATSPIPVVINPHQ